MENKILKQDIITEQGNPAKPEGEAGVKMLERMNESHEKVTNWALDLLDFKEDDMVLDIGCGGGATLQRMSSRMTESSGKDRRNNRKGHLTGVDYSKVSCAQSEERNQKDIDNGRMDIVEASVENMPFAENHFDKITTVESFYFWPDPQENLKEVLRVLKKGGQFLLIADIYENGKLSKTERENIEKYKLTVPTKDEYYNLLENAGFSQITIHTRENENWIAVEGIK